MAKRSNTDGIEFVDTPFTFIGANSGFPYGYCYGDHVAVDLNNDVQNTWYTIADGGNEFSSGLLNSVTHDLNGKLTVAKAGVYWVEFNIAYEVNAANVHVELGIEVDGVDPVADSPHVHTTSKFANQEQDNSAAGIIVLTAGQTIQTSIRTVDVGTPDFFIDNVHLSCMQIGGI